MYAWGDNDHGQQGTGSTIACKVPTRLIGTEGYRVQRVSCGSSHSLAWAETNNAIDILGDLHTLSPSLDPLGTSLVMQKNPFHSPSFKNMAKMMKDQRPSLVRTVLQLHSKDLQKDTLKKILQATEIMFSRKMLVTFLRGVQQTSDLLTKPWFKQILKIESLTKCLKLALNGHASEESADCIEKFLGELCHKNAEVFAFYDFITMFCFVSIFLVFMLTVNRCVN